MVDQLPTTPSTRHTNKMKLFATLAALLLTTTTANSVRPHVALTFNSSPLSEVHRHNVHTKFHDLYRNHSNPAAWNGVHQHMHRRQTENGTEEYGNANPEMVDEPEAHTTFFPYPEQLVDAEEFSRLIALMASLKSDHDKLFGNSTSKDHTSNSTQYKRTTTETLSTTVTYDNADAVQSMCDLLRDGSTLTLLSTYSDTYPPASIHTLPTDSVKPVMKRQEIVATPGPTEHIASDYYARTTCGPDYPEPCRTGAVWRKA